jgi:hypothetical protein
MMETKVWPGIAMPKKNLKKNGVASMSFELIKFAFKTQSKENGFQNTQNGSLLVMKDETQSHWLPVHLPPNLLVSRE